MGLLDKLLGSAVEATGKGVGEVLNGVGDASIKLRAAFTGDLPPDIEVKLRELENQISLAQNDLNKIDAQSGSLFKGGWRPFIGWVCGLSIATYFIPKHLLAAYFWVSICLATGKLESYPIGMTELLELTFAILGLAGFRSFEKSKGVVN